MTDRPNILFIQVDQLTAQTLKSYGDGICHAPTLDALAANGVVFETAYCNFPLCAAVPIFDGNRAVVFNGWCL